MKFINSSRISLKDLYKFLRVFLLCCCLFGFADAQTDSDHSSHNHDETKTSLQNNPATKIVIPDVDVLTQDGKPVKFFTDLVKGKKVLISFIYTSCQTTCPMVGRNFGRLQEQIGKDLGKDVFLISVSTDPTIDNPEILKKWGEKFNRREGWTLVTGEETKIKQLLQTLTGNGTQRALHTSMIFLFDGTNDAWETSSSLMEPILLLDVLSKLRKPPVK